MSARCQRSAMAVVSFAIWTLLGCSQDRSQESLVLAQKSVQVALDTWKRGDPVTTLKTGAVPIEFFDDDWQRSARLVAYEVKSTYTETDGTPRCAVNLQVQYGASTAQQVQVTYQVINKDQTIMIARNPF